MAVDSLRSVAQLLTEAYQPLHDTVHGRADVPEHHSLDTTFLAVKAAADVSPLPARGAACAADAPCAALCCDATFGYMSSNAASALPNKRESWQGQDLWHAHDGVGRCHTPVPSLSLGVRGHL